MRLCWHFRIPEVKEAQRQISDKQFREWLGFLCLEDPEWRADLRSAIIAMTVVNANGGTKDGGGADLLSFMPFPPDFLKEGQTGGSITDIDQVESILKARAKQSQIEEAERSSSHGDVRKT